MSKLQYLATLQRLYRVANMSDSDNPAKAKWLDVQASRHQCQPIDDMLRALLVSGAITARQHQTFYDTL